MKTTKFDKQEQEFLVLKDLPGGLKAGMLIKQSQYPMYDLAKEPSFFDKLTILFRKSDLIIEKRTKKIFKLAEDIVEKNKSKVSTYLIKSDINACDYGTQYVSISDLNKNFEKVEPYYFVNSEGKVCKEVKNKAPNIESIRKKLGIYFNSKEEAQNFVYTKLS